MAEYRPLATALLKQLVIVAVVPFFVTAAFFVWQLYPELAQNAAAQHQVLAKVLANESELYIRGAEEQVDFLEDFLADLPGTQNDEFLRKRLDRFVQNSTHFDAIYFLDTSASITQISIHGAKQAAITALYAGVDMSLTPLYQTRGRLTKAGWSNAFLSVVTGRLSIAYMVVIDSIEGRQRLVAELAIDRLSKLSSHLAESDSLVMILDQTAQLISHPNPNFGQQQINLSNLPFFQKKDQQNLSSSHFQLDGVEYFGTVLAMDMPRWYVVVAQSEKAFSASLYKILEKWLMAIVVAVLLALWMAYRRSLAFSKRFHVLNDLASEVALGHYTHSKLEIEIQEFRELSENLITMAKAIEDRENVLQTKEQQLRDTLERAPNVAVQWYNEFGTVVYWNDASEKIFGYAREEAIGQTLDKLMFDAAATVKFGATLKNVVLKKESNYGFSLPFRHKLGEKGKILGAVFSISSQDGKALLVSMSTDITKQSNAEESIRKLNSELEARVELRTSDLKATNNELNETLDTLNNTVTQLVHSEKLAALGSLVAGVAHELNTPIGNALMAATSLNDFACDIDAKFREGSMAKSTFEQFLLDAQSAAGITYRNLEKASELISSFKHVAVDQSSSQRREFNLSELVSEVLMTLHPQTKLQAIDINIQVSPFIELDSYPGPLGQVISNLVMNAFVHAFPRREDTESAGEDGGGKLEPGRVEIHAQQEAQHVVLIVKDNGVGISDDALTKIFDPFYTSRLGQGGSGLGLHIVHNIVEDILGGQIKVDSQLEQGTSFIISIPLVSPYK